MNDELDISISKIEGNIRTWVDFTFYLTKFLNQEKQGKQFTNCDVPRKKKNKTFWQNKKKKEI